MTATPSPSLPEPLMEEHAFEAVCREYEVDQGSALATLCGQFYARGRASLAPSDPVAIEEKSVWVAWTNTDLTEGRGYQIPLAVCESEATAMRLGARGYVMGGDCPVTEEKAVRIGKSHRWLVPGRIETETTEDKERRLQLEARRAAVQRAKDAGLSEADLKLLKGL